MAADRSKIRASDEDREQAAESLRQHFAAGRLDAEEFDARLSAVYGAKTRGELAELHHDLPAPADTFEPHPRDELDVRRDQLWRRVLQRTVGALGLFVFSTVVWAFTGANGSYWPKWVLVLAVGSLARGAWQLYGPAPDHDQLEAELDDPSVIGRDRRRLR